MIKKYIILVMMLLVMTATASAQEIRGEVVEAAIIDKIESVLVNRGEMRRREVHFLRRMYDVTIPDGGYEIEVTIPGQINYMGMTSVTVRYKVGSRTFKMVNLVVQVRVYDWVLVSAHDLMFDKVVSDIDFRQDEITVDGRNDYIKDFSEIKDLVPIRTIRAGSPVTLAMFQTAQVIELNQPVRLQIKYHGIVASAKGIAMGRGRVGKMIRVKNESSGKIITGKVIDAQTVEVIY